MKENYGEILFRNESFELEEADKARLREIVVRLKSDDLEVRLHDLSDGFIKSLFEKYDTNKIEFDLYVFKYTEEHDSLSVHRRDIDIWESVQFITEFLNKNEDLSDLDLEYLEAHLVLLEEESKYHLSRNISFFDGEILAKLEKFFPDNSFFEEIDAEATQGLDLLPTGPEAFERIIENVKTTNDFIVINMFIWRNDEIGNRLARELINATKRGVHIIILKDALGGMFERTEQGESSFFHTDSKNLKEFLLDNYTDSFYKSVGCTGEAKSLMKELLSSDNVELAIKNEEMETEHGDHSKYFIFGEGRIIMGGMNVGDEYARSVSSEEDSGWRDYMVEVQNSHYVHRLVSRFFHNTDVIKGLSVEFFVNRNAQAIKGIKLAESDDDLVDSFEIEDKMIDMIGRGEEIVIEMAYWGDDDITQAVIDAANRGAKVTLIAPKKANVQESLNKKTLIKIMEATSRSNLRVFLYPSMLHAKVLHIDGQETFLGSANMNVGATEKLGELNIYVNDESCNFTDEVKKSLSSDIVRAVEVKTSKELSYNPSLAMGEANI